MLNRPQPNAWVSRVTAKPLTSWARLAEQPISSQAQNGRSGGVGWSGKEVALLPLPPLRTHRAPFNAVGSSTSKALLDRETRQHLTAPTTRYRPGATKRFRLWAHQLDLSLPSSAFPYRSCLSGFLVTRHLLEVCSFSRRANFEPVSTPLQCGLRFLQHPLPAAPLVGLATVLPIRERIGLTLFRLFTRVG
jgi:hypothetical protein